MARVYRKRPNWVHLLSEANGVRSREQVDLKQDAEPYEVGTVITPEYDAQDEATGLYVRLTAAILAGENPVKAAVLATRTVATDGVKPAVVTARDAEVKGFELEAIEDVTAEQVADVLAAQNIVVR